MPAIGSNGSEVKSSPGNGIRGSGHRLVSAWQGEHRRGPRRELSTKCYVDVWADGVSFAPRLEHDRQCTLALIGADASAKEELLAIDDGFRESEQSWHHELLVRLRGENGLVVDPELATGDEALGRRRRRSGRRPASKGAGCTRRPPS
jgi:hypothetical protein